MEAYFKLEIFNVILKKKTDGTKNRMRKDTRKWSKPRIHPCGTWVIRQAVGCPVSERGFPGNAETLREDDPLSPILPFTRN